MNCCQEHYLAIIKRDKGPTRESSTHAFLSFLCDLYQQVSKRYRNRAHVLEKEMLRTSLMHA